MSLKLATKTMGHCRACSTVIEAADWFDPDAQVHAECRTLKQPEIAEFELTSGFLFSEPEQATIEHAKGVTGVNHISFDGPTALGVDVPRLAGQLARVFELMCDGQYRTLTEIASATGCLETSAGARLRDFRKPKFGGHTVIQRQVEGVPLLYEYRLILNEKKETDGRRHAA